jgi:hypothetical protein
MKRFQPIVGSAKARDVNEADTVTIVKDVLAEIFGFDKYSEITSEYSIRNTYVDLAIKLEGTVQSLIEVKAIGLDMKEAYVKQAVDYAANSGIEWVILTNGALWQVYRVSFSQPISQELVLDVDLLSLNPKSQEDLECLYFLTKEGWGKALLVEYHAKRQVLNRYFIGALMLSDTVLDVLRRELRRVSPDLKIDSEQIRNVLMQEVIKREVVEGEKAEDAKRKINRASSRALRRLKKSEEPEEQPPTEPEGGCGSTPEPGQQDLS